MLLHVDLQGREPAAGGACGLPKGWCPAGGLGQPCGPFPHPDCWGRHALLGNASMYLRLLRAAPSVLPATSNAVAQLLASRAGERLWAETVARQWPCYDKQVRF